MDVVSFLLMRRLSPFQTVIVFLGLFCSIANGQSPSTPTGDPQTGLTGEILIGPIHGGPTRQGVLDSKPLAHTEFLVVSKANSSVSSFQTDDKGKFRIFLPPGHYTVSVKEKAGLGSYGPFEVDIAAGQMKQVQWNCDSGIR
jgi:hypothetical protein